jgi:DNA-binding response OmpR family regulator
MPIPKDLQENTQRVLIVEDDNPMANAIQRVLRKNGFETMIAPNGFRAGLMLERFTPAVITLDLKMPDLSGHEVLKLIRSMEHLALIRILVISAMSQRELDEALKAGADDVLKKPFSNEELVKKVTALSGLEERSSTQGQSLASR